LIAGREDDRLNSASDEFKDFCTAGWPLSTLSGHSARHMKIVTPAPRLSRMQLCDFAVLCGANHSVVVAPLRSKRRRTDTFHTCAAFADTLTKRRPAETGR
jgi:hypothetical protein